MRSKWDDHSHPNQFKRRATPPLSPRQFSSSSPSFFPPILLQEALSSSLSVSLFHNKQGKRILSIFFPSLYSSSLPGLHLPLSQFSVVKRRRKPAASLLFFLCFTHFLSWVSPTKKKKKKSGGSLL
jgi:hypothetical protein